MRSAAGIGVAICVALACASVSNAQTETLAGGVVGDSSIAAPVMVWNRFSIDGDTTGFGLEGLTLWWETRRRTTPRRTRLISAAVTPLRARAADRLYVAGERTREAEFDDTAIELTVGRIDTFGERWSSELRAVAAYEHVDSGDPSVDAFWSSPFAGVRARQRYRRITAEDPLLMTFEGSEVVTHLEVYAGKEFWSRAAVVQRASRRFGRVVVGEQATAFSGHALNRVNAFLAGASWPAGDAFPLYGFRYAELRLKRGAAVTGDVRFELRDSLIVAAHGSWIRSGDFDARGAAIDLTARWNGIGIRVGIAKPFRDGAEERVLIYGSILAARFIHRGD